jgi:two-component system OmpR family sensor kinase
LSAGLFVVIVATSAVAGALSFAWALHDANEILDGTLEKTTSLLASGQISVPPAAAELPGTEPDNEMLVLRLPPTPVRAEDGANPLAALPDGLQTVRWQGTTWRVLVSRSPGGDRVAVAQQTEVRDEIAQHSAVRTLIPLLLLVPLLILLVREVVRRTLAPVSRLAQYVDGHRIGTATHLPDVGVPLEVQPFVHSVQRLLAELTAALEHQQRFVANAAHELRSPMAALQLQAGNVESVLPDDEARRRLKHLQLGIARMEHLLEQLLSMARSQSPAAGDLQPVNLAAAARELLAELVPAAAAKGVDLGMERCDQDVCVAATPIDIATLLRNVVGNAVKYCPEGAAVSLSVLADGPDAVLVVEDDGPGIGEQHLQRVFEPFYRAAASDQPGSGLGLSIVAAIAQRLGGRVALTAAGAGRGTRFEYRQESCSCP